MEFRFSKLFLLIPFFLDLLFIILHFMYGLSPDFERNFFNLEFEYGFSEFYQSLKWLLIIILFIGLYSKKKFFGYVSWGCLFIYIFFDDLIQIHERVGIYIAKKFNFTDLLGLRAQDFGEITVFIFFGLIFFILLAMSYFKGSKEFRKMTKNMLIFILFLILFGVVVDMFHQIINHYPKLNLIVGVVEDGGEMIVNSIILGYLFLFSKSKTSKV